MAPILPGLSDRPEQLAEVVRAARDAGACGIWANVLNLRPGTREHFLDCLAQDWPELLPEYERLLRPRAYLRGAAATEAVRRPSASSRGPRASGTAAASASSRAPSPQQLRLDV